VREGRRRRQAVRGELSNTGGGAGGAHDIGRNGFAENFAGAAVFLSGRASGYITGHAILIDGGLSVH
jgi:NAD(P)-dependent dehydrogenase (short-subunit alcohol dehydrogenase family)